MKLKQRPDDFQVEELTDVRARSEGAYTLYRLQKSGQTTHDALAIVRRRWKIDRRRISFAGLKDRHAATVQYFTIFHGPERKLTQNGIAVDCLGRLGEAYTSDHMRANRFQIVLRRLTPAEVESAEQVLAHIESDGLPNYFDDQRFGSASPGGEFVAKKIVLQQYEEALYLALAAPYRYDRSADKKSKHQLRRHWGDWQACGRTLPPGPVRAVIDYLSANPKNFCGAVERLRPELRGLYLSAYQGHLWNCMLSKWITENEAPHSCLMLPAKLAELPVPCELSSEANKELEDLQLPLPSPRHALTGGDERLRLMEAVLQQENITLEQLRLRNFRSLFFSRGFRPAWYFPQGVRYNMALDERHDDYHKLELRFELPRGCYATLVVKRLALHHPSGTLP